MYTQLGILIKAVFVKIHFLFKIELSVVKVCVDFGDTVYITMIPT